MREYTVSQVQAILVIPVSRRRVCVHTYVRDLHHAAILLRTLIRYYNIRDTVPSIDLIHNSAKVLAVPSHLHL